MLARSTSTGSIVVVGEPHDTEEYRATARGLGYDDDILGMCQDHDPLHVALCRWLGLSTSFSMLSAVGKLPVEQKYLADAEETAVIAIQRFMRLAGGNPPR